jgi:peptidoglycan/xylan/chitin deacetylase (PgdA/CDA1 family)
MHKLLQRIYDFFTGPCIRTITFQGAPENAIYLTFDDGPVNFCTPKVLDLLKRHDIQATFFIIGKKARNLRPIIERFISEGHKIGNHTIDHDTSRYFSTTHGIKDWLLTSENMLNQDLGVSSIGFRSPVGIKTPILNKVLRTMNMPLILWDVRFYDTRYGLSIKAVTKKLPTIQAGSIILLHDTHKGSKRVEFLEALEHLIIECKKKGLVFLPLSNTLVLNSYLYKYENFK